jgi:hypothetical protein
LTTTQHLTPPSAAGREASLSLRQRPTLLHNNNAPPAEHRAVAMVKIIDKIRLYDQPDRPKEPFFSFEYFPPKTDAGVENL